MMEKSSAFKDAPPMRPPSTCSLLSKLIGVFGVHGAAILDGQRISRIFTIEACNYATD